MIIGNDLTLFCPNEMIVETNKIIDKTFFFMQYSLSFVVFAGNTFVEEKFNQKIYTSQSITASFSDFILSSFAGINSCAT